MFRVQEIGITSKSTIRKRIKIKSRIRIRNCCFEVGYSPCRTSTTNCRSPEGLLLACGVKSVPNPNLARNLNPLPNPNPNRNLSTPDGWGTLVPCDHRDSRQPDFNRLNSYDI